MVTPINAHSSSERPTDSKASVPRESSCNHVWIQQPVLMPSMKLRLMQYYIPPSDESSWTPVAGRRKNRGLHSRISTQVSILLVIHFTIPSNLNLAVTLHLTTLSTGAYVDVHFKLNDSSKTPLRFVSEVDQLLLEQDSD